MARTYNHKSKHAGAKGRRLSARIVRREVVDLDLLTDAFVGLALARIENEAQQQQHEQTDAFTAATEGDHDVRA